MTETQFAISVRQIRKAFGATVALDGASFAVKTGSVHALLGENGAGKSTIVKMLSGLVRPDSGTIEIFGRNCQITNPRDAHALGIQTAFQEMLLVRDLTVVQNMLLPYEPVGRLGGVQRRQARKLVTDHLHALGLDDIDIHREVRELDLPVRQKIEIARAVLRRPKILLLDEPTSTLSGRDIDWLGEVIARLKAQGTTVIFISHRMPEVRRFCEDLTVLRNGKDVGSGLVAETNDDEVIRMIIGRSLASTFPPRVSTVRPGGAPALTARDISTDGRLANASFVLAEGEVLGVAGLQGMGQLDLFFSCFGLMPLRSGGLAVYGKKVRLASPQDAVRANIGISLVPEDRKTEALFLKLDGRRNVSLPVIDRFTRFGLIDGRAEIEAVGRILDRTPSAAASTLYARLRVQRWQPAEDRGSEMAACREPHPVDVRRNARCGYRHKARHLRAGPRFRQGRRLGAVLFDRDSRISQSLRPRPGYLRRSHCARAGERRPRRGSHHARRAGGNNDVRRACCRGKLMATATLSSWRSSSSMRSLARNEGALVITGVFILLLLIVSVISNGFGYYEFNFLTAGGAALALAVMGQALIVLVGGFDLSVGAAVSLVNAVLATNMAPSLGSELSWGVAALAIGGLIGAVNGFFVAFLRVQSIAATLSTMFLLRGLALLVLPDPGGSVPPDVTSFFTGTAIPHVLPAALVVILVAIAVWLAIKRTRLGTAIYAVGSDDESAKAAGVRVRWTKFAAFVIGGFYFGAAGLFVSAQSGAGDPLVGNPMLLETFAAVVLGGTLLGGGRGGCIGPVFGAYTLMLMVNILLVLNVSAYYSTVVEGAILILAVLAGSFHQELADRPLCPTIPRTVASLAQRHLALANPGGARTRPVPRLRIDRPLDGRDRVRQSVLGSAQQRGPGVRAAVLSVPDRRFRGDGSRVRRHADELALL